MMANVRKVIFTACLAGLIPAASHAQQSPVADPGRRGDPASWRTQEFQENWGLGRLKVEHAYAQGITGEGVSIGILGTGFDIAHPKLGQRFTAVGPTAGIGSGGDVDEDDPTNWSGLRMSGVAGATRDGRGMHGVAFGAKFAVAPLAAEPGVTTSGGLSYGARLKSSRGGGAEQARADVERFATAYRALQQAGVRIINNSWGAAPKSERSDSYGDLYAAYATHYKRPTWLDAAVEVSRAGVVNVFSAGNAGDANPSLRATMPYFQPELEGHWLAVTGVRQDGSLPLNSCGLAKHWCVAAPVASRTITPRSSPGNYDPEDTLNTRGTGAAAAQVSGALALVMQRFPYMDNAQAVAVLLTTSERDGLRSTAPDAKQGWGVPNLQSAMDGPGQLLGVTRVNLPAGVSDTWRNDISDLYLVERGKDDALEDKGWREALADNGWKDGPLPASATPSQRMVYEVGERRIQARRARVYEGSLIKSGDGELVLTGNNTYRGGTTVDGGRLRVDGALSSKVTVNATGTLSGTGSVGGLHANPGGTVAPGHSIGTLDVAGDVAFEPGSIYQVEVAQDGRADRIRATGKAALAGGQVRATLEHDPNPLSQETVRSMLGRRFLILDAAQGVSGRFDSVLPGDYLFMRTALDYDANAVYLSMARNERSFASVAATANQRRTATAIESLGLGNPVFESVLNAPTAGVAQGIYGSLTGEVYPALTAIQANGGQRLRAAAINRLGAEEPGTWAQAVSAWSRTRGDGNASGHRGKTGGFLAGRDFRLGDQSRIGLLAGYTHDDVRLDSATGTAKADSLHLGIYAGWQAGPLGLQAGAGYTRSRYEVTRNLSQGAMSDRLRANLDGDALQGYAQAGYALGLGAAQVEPFGRFSYRYLRRGGFDEAGGGAALKGRSQADHLASVTLGLNLSGRAALPGGHELRLRASAGWQHELAGTRPQAHLAFAAGGQGFRVDGVSLPRDAAVVDVSVGIARATGWNSVCPMAG